MATLSERLYDLERNDPEAALQLARDLAEAGALDEGAMDTLLRMQDDPTDFLDALLAIDDAAGEQAGPGVTQGEGPVLPT